MFAANRSLIPIRHYVPRICLQNFSQQDSYSRDEMTHFGFQTISEVDKKNKVIDIFSSVSTKYDLMNDLMSAGTHRIWKNTFVNDLNPMPDYKILDVAGGTGDIAFRILEKIKEPSPDGHLIVCDINKSMLDEMLSPLQFEDNSFDAYTIAFGIRNVVRIHEALEEAYRVLKPGGRFMCLEFAPMEQPILGEVITGDWDSYQYLIESIHNFPPQEEFMQMIKNAGFRFVTYKNLSLGIVAIHSGFKII
ncbi:COQ5 [Lepeophtheirus salmonis]|uniref:2-methoxy-6-polyprenyl-1,4-benzoquinol methylase, mitochondrial n=1 Tax=Lepeophtheirus salmonis TaxID=72036 RepID=A0A7R8CI73_LEPSM|nr:COQ5 [Lepeophtheirus salmonis]CAF2829065.1 COQ5 [Lepeophtheirus salmonis]